MSATCTPPRCMCTRTMHLASKSGEISLHISHVESCVGNDIIRFLEWKKDERGNRIPVVSPRFIVLLELSISVITASTKMVLEALGIILQEVAKLGMLKEEFLNQTGAVLLFILLDRPKRNATASLLASTTTIPRSSQASSTIRRHKPPIRYNSSLSTAKDIDRRDGSPQQQDFIKAPRRGLD